MLQTQILKVKRMNGNLLKRIKSLSSSVSKRTKSTSENASSAQNNEKINIHDSIKIKDLKQKLANLKDKHVEHISKLKIHYCQQMSAIEYKSQQKISKLESQLSKAQTEQTKKTEPGLSKPSEEPLLNKVLLHTFAPSSSRRDPSTKGLPHKVEDYIGGPQSQSLVPVVRRKSGGSSRSHSPSYQLVEDPEPEKTGNNLKISPTPPLPPKRLSDIFACQLRRVEESLMPASSSRQASEVPVFLNPQIHGKVGKSKGPGKTGPQFSDWKEKSNGDKSTADKLKSEKAQSKEKLAPENQEVERISSSLERPIDTNHEDTELEGFQDTMNIVNDMIRRVNRSILK